MVSLGSRVFFGAAAFGAVAGTAYLGTTGDRTGLGLFAALLVAALVAGFALSPRTAADQVTAGAPAERHELGEAEPAIPSMWPVAGALAAGLAAVGLVAGDGFVWVGLGLAAVVAAGFYGQGWRAANPESYELFRQRVLAPLSLPIGAALVIGVLVLPFSRVLLTVSKTGSVVVAIVVATIVLLAAFAIAARPSVLNSSLGVALLLLAGVGVIAGGIVSAAIGEREIAHHGQEEHVPGAGAPVVEIGARDFEFDMDRIEVTAGDDHFFIRFENEDQAVPHNVSIYATEDAANAGEEAIFLGDIFPGRDRETYEVETPPPGTYYFRCDVHPNMEGELVVQ